MVIIHICKDGEIIQIIQFNQGQYHTLLFLIAVIYSIATIMNPRLFYGLGVLMAIVFFDRIFLNSRTLFQRED